MATTVMSSLAFAAAGARAGRYPAAVAALAPRRRRAVVSVRAQSKPDDVDAVPASKTMSTGLWDALAFSGPAPERVNGRLAMVGFVSALAVEASTHGGAGGLLAQAASGTGQAWFAYVAAALSAASLIPLLQGETAEARGGAAGGGGLWNADAELWNGRLAMLGLVALVVTEYLTGAPFINA